MALGSRLIAVAVLLSLSPSALAQPTAIVPGTSNAAAEARSMAVADTRNPAPTLPLRNWTARSPVPLYTVPPT
jgi:hypothetical protein